MKIVFGEMLISELKKLNLRRQSSLTNYTQMFDELSNAVSIARVI